MYSKLGGLETCLAGVAGLAELSGFAGLAGVLGRWLEYSRRYSHTPDARTRSADFSSHLWGLRFSIFFCTRFGDSSGVSRRYQDTIGFVFFEEGV